MSSDTSGISISMRVFQLLGEMIPIEHIEQALPTRDRATKVEWAFASSLRIAPGQQGQKKESELIESDYSAAWHEVDKEYSLLPGHFLALSGTKYAQNDRSQQKIDGAFYPDEFRDDVVDDRPNWVRMGLPVEFLRGRTDLDPFNDRPGHNFEADANKRKEVRGQVMSYGEHVFSDQHRTALYMLFVNGPIFRVMRWDHSGVIVTEAVDYLHSVDGTTCLLTFLHCYSTVGPQRQGIDTTAVPLSQDSCGWQRMDVVAVGSKLDLDSTEHDLEDGTALHVAYVDPSRQGAVSLGDDDSVLHQEPTATCKSHSNCHHAYSDVVPEFTHAREYFRNSIAGGHPRYMIKVGDMTLLVGRHMFKASGLIGRGTRGFVALDWQSQRLVFLKDAWRPHYDGMQEEGEILERLNQANVPNVPTVLAHGDVEGQETEASNYSPFTGPKKVKSFPAWPVRNDFEARVVEIEQESSQKALPATVAAPDAGHSMVQSLTAHSSLTALSGPAVFPAGTLPAPPLPSHGLGPSSEYIALLVSPPVDDARSTSEVSEESADDSTGDKVQPESATAKGKRSAEDMEKCEPGTGLRHLIHFRVVMKDVCIGSMAFKNGRQWVSIILDCVTAHSEAYDNCGYIHRDVSAGNILIRPVLLRNGNKVSVYWQGMLTDWELAKHKDVGYAREPDRTGTWPYMSWKLLSFPGDSVSIADELEAFVHVLVYGSVRFVYHDFNTIHGFMYSYFDGFSLNADREFACPPAKRACIQAGQLTDGDRPIRFIDADGLAKHPLNDLTMRLLNLFKIRYEVLLWKKTHAPETPRKMGVLRDPAATASSSTTDEKPRVLYAKFSRQPVAAHSPSTVTKEATAKEGADKPPTPEMLTIAASLDDHRTVGMILQEFLDLTCTPTDLEGPAVWPLNDKGPDRLADYMPTDRTAVTQTLQKPSKRQRTNTDSKPVKAESSTSRTKAAPIPRQLSSRSVVPPSDRTTRSQDGTLPGPSRDRGLPRTASSRRTPLRRGSDRAATVNRAGSDSTARPSNPTSTQAATSHSRGTIQAGRARRNGSKRGKGKTPAHG